MPISSRAERTSRTEERPAPNILTNSCSEGILSPGLTSPSIKMRTNSSIIADVTVVLLTLLTIKSLTRMYLAFRLNSLGPIIGLTDCQTIKLVKKTSLAISLPNKIIA